MPITMSFPAGPAPSADRPLLGLTVLLVEDSRYACEAVRLMCLRSGARIRRADSLHNARRHLKVYRPDAVIADLGLPDGSGIELIVELAQASPRIDILLATSGDPQGEAPALAAGADGFLAKPMLRLGPFQQALLSRLPAERRPAGPRLVDGEEVAPDPVALRDDLALAETLLGEGWPLGGDTAYVAQFLAGVARGVGDEELRAAAEALGAAGRSEGTGAARHRLSALLAARLAAAEPV